MNAAVAVLGLALAASAGAVAPDAVPGTLSALDPATNDRVVLDWSQGPTHVAFIATWCRPCIDEMPRLFDLEDRWKPEGYRLILVALPTRQTMERLREFQEQGPLPGRLLFDADGSLAAAFGVTAIPSHALLDRQGRVVARSGAADAAFGQSVERTVRQEGRSKR